MYALYLLIGRNDRTYTGITKDIVRRIRQHNGEIKGGAKATRACRPWRLVGQVKSIPTQSIAQVMEHQARKQAITSRHSHKSMLQSRIQALMDTADKHKLTCFFTGPPESWI